MLFLFFLHMNYSFPHKLAHLGFRACPPMWALAGSLMLPGKEWTHKSKKRVCISIPWSCPQQLNRESSFVFTHHFYCAMGMVQDFKYSEFFLGHSFASGKKFKTLRHRIGSKFKYFNI